MALDRRRPRHNAGATEAGLATIGIEPEYANILPVSTTDAPSDEPAPEPPSETGPAPKARTPREGTKHATLIAMLRVLDDPTIEEIMVATNWASHTVRGALAGGVEEETQARSHLGDGRRAWKGLSAPGTLTAPSPFNCPSSVWGGGPQSV